MIEQEQLEALAELVVEKLQAKMQLEEIKGKLNG